MGDQLDDAKSPGPLERGLRDRRRRLAVRPLAPAPVNAPKRPPIESSSKFRSALGKITSRAFDQAIKPLLELEEDDPNSCVVKFYLSLARNEDPETQSDADVYLRKAFAVPGADKKLLAWSKNHDEVGPYLVRFAAERIQGADEWADAIDTGSSIPDQQRDSYYRVPTYQLAGEALKLACELDPESRQIQYLVAKTERMDRKYASAYERLSNLISCIKADKKSDEAPLLFSCNMMRSWIAFLWADHDPHQKRDDETRKRLLLATRDLDICQKYLDNCTVDDQIRKQYHVMHDALRAKVTLAEVELALLRVADGKKSYDQAEKMFVPLNKYIKAYRLKVPKTEDLEARLEALRTRFYGPRSEGIASSG